MSAMVKVQNRLPQAININLKNAKGEHVTKTILPRLFVDVNASELTQSVFDLVRHGHLHVNAVNAVEEKPAPVPAPAPKSESKFDAPKFDKK